MELVKFRYIMTLVIYSVVCVLGLSGNGVVIWATGFRMKKTVNTVWYLNLAVADFMATAVLPFAITDTALDKHWPFGSFVCKMGGMFFFMNMYASIFILTVISVDRCVCVVRPGWSQNHHRTIRKACWVSLGVWVLAMALSAPNYVFRETRPWRDGDNKVWCDYNFALVDDYYRHTLEDWQLAVSRLCAVTITNFIAGFVVPFSVIVSCYSIIVYRLRNDPSLASRSGRSFKIIAAVIAAFFLCWLPFHVIQLIIALETTFTATLRRVIFVGFPISFALALTNSCLNPLLYVFLGQGFRDVFRRSILKHLEKAFAEEPPEADNTPTTDPDAARPEMTTLCETEHSTVPPGAKDPSQDTVLSDTHF